MHWIREQLSRSGARPLCLTGTGRATYADLLAQIDALGERWAGRARQLVDLPTDAPLEALAGLLAAALHNQIALPLPPRCPPALRAQRLQIADRHPLYTQLGGSGLVLFSSGSSGAPKAMLHDFGALLQRYAELPARDYRAVLLLPLDHIGGIDAALRAVCSGAALVIPEAISPEAVAAAIEQHRATVLPASPTFLNLMRLNAVHRHHDLSSIRVVAYGAEPMPPSLLKELPALFPGARFEQRFGTSETGTVRIKSSSDQSTHFRIEDSTTQWKIEDGMLWLKTPSRIIGYLNAEPGGLEADGWFATGDLAAADSEGNIRIIGRADATINVGGHKVHPAEVEAAIRAIDGVADCTIEGRPDPVTGQAISCTLVPEPGQPDDPLHWKRAIRKACRGTLANWQLPSRVTCAKTIELSPRLKRG